jgi:hypothetical protein
MPRHKIGGDMEVYFMVDIGPVVGKNELDIVVREPTVQRT